MQINLTPEQEAMIRGEIATGHYRTPEEVVAKALHTLLEKEPGAASQPHGQREAVREMLDFVEKNHVRLDGVSVKDLIHEGHRL